MLKKIINMLDREEVSLAAQYWQLRKPFMKKCTQCPNSVAEYGDPFNKGELPLHSDRPECEISITLNIQADKPWKLWVKRKGTKTRGLTLNPGEAILYQGMKYKHWRTPYTGKECMQIFLHYVRANGPFKSRFRDGRERFGTPYGNK